MLANNHYLNYKPFESNKNMASTLNNLSLSISEWSQRREQSK
jgi:hypothetical protein